MAVGTKFHSFSEALGRKVHNLNVDVLKVMLTNVLPLVGNSVKADITEITAGNGYPAGGVAVPNTVFAQVAGVGKLTGDDVSIAAAAGPIGPFQWVVLYNDSALNDELIAFWPRAAPVTLQDGEAMLTDFDQVNGILQIT